MNNSLDSERESERITGYMNYAITYIAVMFSLAFLAFTAPHIALLAFGGCVVYALAKRFPKVVFFSALAAAGLFVISTGAYLVYAHHMGPVWAAESERFTIKMHEDAVRQIESSRYDGRTRDNGTVIPPVTPMVWAGDHYAHGNPESASAFVPKFDVQPAEPTPTPAPKSKIQPVPNFEQTPKPSTRGETLYVNS
jgi:hypothetical protein